MGIQERKEREKEQRKSNIMDCALKVFLAKGVVNSTMDEIAECAELSKATLYLYFRNKEEIILNVMYDVLKTLIDYIEDRMSKVESPLDKIRMIGEGYLAFYDECHGQYLLLSSQESTVGMDFTNLDKYHDYIAQNNRFWEVACAPIYAAIAEGYLPKQANAVEIAITLWSSCKGLMYMMNNVIATVNCESYKKSADMTDFYNHLDTLNYKIMLRNLVEAIITRYQNSKIK